MDLWGGWWTLCLRHPSDSRIQGLPPHYLLVAVLEIFVSVIRGFKFAADKCIHSVCRFIQELTGGVNEPHQ